MNRNKHLAYLLLRVSVGIMFLSYGIGKFQGGVGGFAAGMKRQFAGKLPALLVTPFAYALPFAEVLIGALLVVGLFNAVALVLAGTLMVALTFGAALMGTDETVAHNISFALVIFVLLWTADNNAYSVGRLRRNASVSRTHR